jgi:hypothetical protein
LFGRMLIMLQSYFCKFLALVLDSQTIYGSKLVEKG